MSGTGTEFPPTAPPFPSASRYSPTTPWTLLPAKYRGHSIHIPLDIKRKISLRIMIGSRCCGVGVKSIQGNVQNIEIMS